MERDLKVRGLDVLCAWLSICDREIDKSHLHVDQIKIGDTGIKSDQSRLRERTYSRRLRSGEAEVPCSRTTYVVYILVT